MSEPDDDVQEQTQGQSSCPHAIFVGKRAARAVPEALIRLLLRDHPPNDAEEGKRTLLGYGLDCLIGDTNQSNPNFELVIFMRNCQSCKDSFSEYLERRVRQIWMQDRCLGPAQIIKLARSKLDLLDYRADYQETRHLKKCGLCNSQLHILREDLTRS